MFERVVESAASRSAKRRRRMLPGQRPSGAVSRFGFERLEARIVLSASTLINEIDVNSPGMDDNRYMYVELEGTPGASLNNMYFVAFQSGGNAELVQSLSGFSIGADGLAVIKNSTGGFSLPAATTLIPNNTFFTSTKDTGFTQDTLSFYLFSSPNSFIQGADYDSNGDGTLDHLPSGAIALDNVAVLDKTGDVTYGGVIIQNFHGGGAPDAVTRFFGSTATATSSWFGGELANTNISDTVLYDTTRTGTNTQSGAYITPGTVNFPVPAGPTLTPTTGSATFTAGSSPIVVDSGITLVDPESTTISSATVTTTAFSEDAYGFTTPPTMQATITQGHNGQGAVNVITLTGLDSVANYQAALRSITYQDTTLSGPTLGTRTLSITINDGITTANATKLVNVTVAPPTVQPGLSGIYTVLGLGVNVDATLGVTSSDADVTGASLTISSATRQTDDSLSYIIPAGSNITTSGYNPSTGILSFGGSSTPANYQMLLRSVQFSSTNGTAASTTARNISIVANDTNASGSSTPISETLFVNPVVNAGGPGTYTAGSSAAVAVDAGMTLWSGPNLSSQNNVTGAVVSLTNDAANDLLTYTIPVGSGISVVGSGYDPSTGKLSFTGNSTAANYQTLLQSVSFSNTVSSSTTARNFTFQFSDSLDDASSGGLTSNALGESLTVSPPVTVAGAWVNGGSSWSAIDTYFGSQNEGSATNGWALQTGTNQLTTLPWTTINTVVVRFSGTVNKVALGSLELVGGTLGTIAPTSLATLGTNTYAWTFGSDLVNQQYVLAIATTGSSFGTTGVSRVVDSGGAGISGKFTASSSAFPSGNGLAGSTFDFSFNVLPGDADQNANDNSNDTLDVKTLSSNTRSTAGNYDPFYDLDANGTINSNDVLEAKGFSGRLSGSSPNAPSASQVASPVGTGFAALALGVLDGSSTSLATGNSTSLATGNSPTVANVLPAGANLPSTSASTTSSTNADSVDSNSPPPTFFHGRHKFAATDESVSAFDPAHIWI